MPHKKLTARTVQALKPGPKRTDYFDTSLPNFHVRVTATGAKSYSVLYRHAGRLRRYTIGSTREVDLAKAREKASEVLWAARNGKDPAAEKKRERMAEMFSELAEKYIEDYAKAPVRGPDGSTRPRKKSWKEDQRIISRYLLPSFRHVHAKDVTRADVRALLKKIHKRGPIMANRTLACVRKIYSWGVSEEHVEVNPCTGLSAPGVEQRRDRVLTEGELKKVWKAIEAEPIERGGPFVLRLLTAQRGGEIATMRWEDIEGEWWTIPAERSKNKLPHRVWLSGPALRILERIRAARDASSNERKRNSPWVFPHRRRPEEPMNNLQRAVQRIREKAGVEFRGHDLRRTTASLMTGMGISRLVVGKILNHAEPGVTSVYDRHAYDTEKREALDKWASRLMTIVSDLQEVKKPEHIG